MLERGQGKLGKEDLLGFHIELGAYARPVKVLFKTVEMAISCIMHRIVVALKMALIKANSVLSLPNQVEVRDTA